MFSESRFSESILDYKIISVRYYDGSKEFGLDFGVAIKLALLKTNKSWVVASFIGEPILYGNQDGLDQKNVFHTYISIRGKIKTAAMGLVRKDYEKRGIHLMIPQYN